MAVIAALVSVLGTALLAWLIGTRVTYGWDEVKRQRESDMDSLKLFYECYGKFFGAWKAWAVYTRNMSSNTRGFPASDPRAWEILRVAGEAESGFETILVKLASEYAHSEADRLLFASFRQGAQSLREAIRDGKDLTWKAQQFSTRDRGRSNTRRLVDYRKYRAFKALCEYVAVTLRTGPYKNASSFARRRRLLIGFSRSATINHRAAIAALISITQTENVGGRWWTIAEDAFALPPVPTFAERARTEEGTPVTQRRKVEEPFD